MGVAQSIIDAEPDAESAIGQIKATIEREQARLKMLARNPELTPQTVLGEVAGTALALLADQAEFLDELDKHAGWLDGRLEALSEEREGSRLLPDDAERFRVYTKTVIEVCDKSLGQADPDSAPAQSLRMLKAQSLELLKLIEEIELEPPEDEDDEDEDDEEDDDPDEEGDDDDDDDDEGAP